jgi:hypothetical protein
MAGLLSNRIEDKNQIFVIDPSGGEASVNQIETAISNFAWSDDGKTIATLPTNRQPSLEGSRSTGDYDVVRQVTVMRTFGRWTWWR